MELKEHLQAATFCAPQSLRRAVSEFMSHYHAERNDQGLKNCLIREMPKVAANDGEIHRRSRLGGLFNFYYLTSGLRDIIRDCGHYGFVT